VGRCGEHLYTARQAKKGVPINITDEICSFMEGIAHGILWVIFMAVPS
jgi:hypothetical protein